MTEPRGCERSIAELLAGVGMRDPVSWGEIVQRFQRLVFSRARRYDLPEADVLDAVQVTWLRLAEHWETVEHPERLAGWLATTVQRECLRIVNEHRAVVRVDDVLDRVVDPHTGPEDQVVEADTASAVRRLVEELEKPHRDLLDALFYDDTPAYAELSRRIGRPIGSIGPTRARSLRRLRTLIEEHELAPTG